MTTTEKSTRMASIDLLRGLDMFFLVGAGEILLRLLSALGASTDNIIIRQLHHAEWTGFTAWDIIMPLFLFTSGLSMPFSFDKYIAGGNSKIRLHAKVIKRFLLLFLLGWIAQGNLLDLDPSTFHIYCNTLHAIAAGYIITALIVLNIRRPAHRIAIAAGLLIAYSICLSFIPVEGFGRGSYTPDGNIAIHIDHAIFGRFDDGTQYTWLLTSLSFAATVLSGYFAGSILQSSGSPDRKLKILLLAGLALIATGMIISLEIPIIKKIWSPSMVLLSSGISYLLLALCYLLTDKIHLSSRWIDHFRIFGLNSITAYMLHTTFHLGDISRRLLHGLEQYTGDFYPFIITLGEFAIITFILHHMYKRRIFLKI
jgi:predicted acyltransferase